MIFGQFASDRVKALAEVKKQLMCIEKVSVAEIVISIVMVKVLLFTYISTYIHTTIHKYQHTYTNIHAYLITCIPTKSNP